MARVKCVVDLGGRELAAILLVLGLRVGAVVEKDLKRLFAKNLQTRFARPLVD